MEKKPRHLRLVHSQDESELKKPWPPLEKVIRFGKYIKGLVGVSPVKEAPATPETESYRTLKSEEKAWWDGRYW
jgi:hypothetical protein